LSFRFLGSAVLFLTLMLHGAAPCQRLTSRLAPGVHASEHGELRYRIFVPEGSAKIGAKYPLVVFLHGAGERGSDNARQLRLGVREFVGEAAQAARPCFVLAPQCPRRVWWNVEQLLELVVSVRDAHPVDRDRVYITGLSMGGYATWHVIGRRPELFAAAIPVCGGGEIETAAKLTALPIWAFHGDADRTVPAQKSREMVEAIEEAGGAPKYTEYPGVGHDSWTRTYTNPKVHEWLFAQRRGGASIATVALKNGDRIVFFGDSITEAGAQENGYIRVMEADLEKRRPELEVELIGAGISSHRVPDLQKRLDRDVLGKKPSIVVIYIGINDVWHWNHNRGTEKADFDAGLRDLIHEIDAAGARVILCTPSVIGEKTDGSNEFDAMLEEYSAISRRVAADTGAQLLDLRKRFMEFLATHNGDNAAVGLLTGDTVHLNAAGNRFVADCMLEALGVR
jgi:poly(3-hydroxybutyrate) depolymerase